MTVEVERDGKGDNEPWSAAEGVRNFVDALLSNSRVGVDDDQLRDTVVIDGYARPMTGSWASSVIETVRAHRVGCASDMNSVDSSRMDHRAAVVSADRLSAKKKRHWLDAQYVLQWSVKR